MDKAKRYTRIILLVLLFSSFIFSHKQKIQQLFNVEKTVFENVLSNEKLDIKKVYDNKGELLGLKQSIANAHLGGVKTENIIAFYINAYNVQFMHQLNSIYPLKSLEEEPNFFTMDTFQVAREAYNLKSLRKKIYQISQDPRIHFCLLTGGISSPRLPRDAFSSKSFYKKIEFISKQLISDNNVVKIKSRSELLLLPQYFQWFKDDFGIKEDQDYLNWINTYLDEEQKVSETYKVLYYPYSWNLYR